MQYISVGAERNLQRSIFIPHKRDMIGRKIRRENNIWSIGKKQEQKEQLRYEMSSEHITTHKAM